MLICYNNAINNNISFLGGVGLEIGVGLYGPDELNKCGAARYLLHVLLS